ncbi:17847_t:CDS:2 [Funneliformis caledonium]|uniref:17847_t:CDS:1 n=1 Tax=Funneliformis caledonium TaxID=1117310 RepID=A0A9N8V379_9GLOM|nr:17847_t:CDS:2 [Funneliformis caledonium]
MTVSTSTRASPAFVISQYPLLAKTSESSISLTEASPVILSSPTPFVFEETHPNITQPESISDFSTRTTLLTRNNIDTQIFRLLLMDRKSTSRADFVMFGSNRVVEDTPTSKGYYHFEKNIKPKFLNEHLKLLQHVALSTKVVSSLKGFIPRRSMHLTRQKRVNVNYRSSRNALEAVDRRGSRRSLQREVIKGSSRNIHVLVEQFAVTGDLIKEERWKLYIVAEEKSVGLAPIIIEMLMNNEFKHVKLVANYDENSLVNNEAPYKWLLYQAISEYLRDLGNN